MKILIAGYYGLGNIGDEAILSGIVNSIRTHEPSSEFHVLTHDPADMARLHQISPIPHSAKRGVKTFLMNQIAGGEFFRIIDAVEDADVFILGGGELLQDHRFHYLPTMYSLLQLAQRKGKISVVYGIGAGPIETSFGRWLTKRVLSDCDMVTVRDLKSKHALEECGASNVVLTADPAFSMIIPDDMLLKHYLDREGEIVADDWIGMTLHSNLFDDDLYRKSHGVSVNQDLRREVIFNLMTRIVNEQRRKLVLMPTAPADVSGFRKILDNGEPNDQCRIMAHSSDFRRFLSILTRAEAIVGMKLHSLILASLAGVPYVPIIYSDKVRSFVEAMNLNDISFEIEGIEDTGSEEEIANTLWRVREDKARYSKLLLDRSMEMAKKSLENGRLLHRLTEDVGK